MVWNEICWMAVTFILASADDSIADQMDSTTILIVVLVSAFGAVMFIAVLACILFSITLRAHRKEEIWQQNKSKVMKTLVPSDYFHPPEENQPPKLNDPTKPNVQPEKKEEKNRVKPDKASGKKLKGKNKVADAPKRPVGQQIIGTVITRNEKPRK